MTDSWQAHPADAEVRLPRPPGVFRRWLAAHPRAVDASIVVCYLIGCGLMLFVDAANERWVRSMGRTVDEFTAGALLWPGYALLPWLPLTLLRLVAVGWALWQRRRFPVTGVVITALAFFGPQGSQAIATGVAAVFLLYAVPIYRRSVVAWWVAYGIAVVGMAGADLLEEMRLSLLPRADPLGPLVTGVTYGSSGAVDWRSWSAQAVVMAIMYLAVVVIAINLGNRRRYVSAIIERAHQLARERDQLAQLAVAEERSRIAREMHDIVAHSVSVMIALSEGASRAVEAAPSASADAMRRSAETGRTALAEMRRLLGALNAPEQQAELVPQPGLEELSALVRGFTEAGLRVELGIAGDPSGDRGQELAVYRLVQEGLTNTLRYAGSGARAVVTVHGSPDRTVVEVRDYGRIGDAPLPVAGVGSGRGLAGLAERVRVFGGRLDSGPVAAAEGGGWRLRAVLPVNAEARGGAGSPGGEGA